MQEKWKDLIPFYVAGTLSDKDKTALEAYLTQCGEPCNDEIEEWRAIASATWQHVDANTPALPPLSQAVLAEVARDAPLRASGKIVTSDGFRGDSIDQTGQAPVYPRQGQPSANKIRRAPRVPLTMVAAFMTVVIFGGILLTQLNPSDIDPQAQVQELTEVANNVTVAASQEFGAEVGIQPENPDSGVVSTPTPRAPQPTATFVPTATPLPTRALELPPNSGGGLDTSSIAAIDVAPGTCIIRNDTQGALTTYQNASFDSQAVGLMGQGGENSIQIVFDGWYMLSYGNWVYGENVTVIGDCSQAWTATPTAIGDDGTYNGVPECIVRNDGTEFIPLYQWPDESSPANGRFSPGQQADVYIGENGWYQVFYAQWVNGNNVTIEGIGCNQLWIPTSTVPAPIMTATPLPPPSNQPVAVVKTSASTMRRADLMTSVVVEFVTQGTNLTVLAHNGASGAQRWYQVRSSAQNIGWIPASDVDVIPNDANVPFSTAQPTPNPSPTFAPTLAPLENWSHITTVVEHGCGGTVGEQETIATQLQRLGTQVIVTYPATGTSFALNQIAPNAFAGSYGTSTFVQVDLSFASSTTYTANETVTHESGCIVRTTWSGTKQ